MNVPFIQISDGDQALEDRPFDLRFGCQVLAEIMLGLNCSQPSCKRYEIEKLFLIKY